MMLDHLLQLGDIGILQCVLVLRRTDPAADLNVLAHLHVERDAFDAGHVALQPRHDLVRGRIPIGERLQIDQHAALAERAGLADPVVHVVHVGIGHHDAAEALDPVGHGIERDIGSGFGHADDQAGVLLREQPFGATA